MDSLAGLSPGRGFVVNKAPAAGDVVPQWPLVLGVGLLAVVSVVNMRVGKDGPALVCAAGALALPVLGLALRSYLGVKGPRVRRVVVSHPAPVGGASPVPLDTAKYLTPPPRKRLRGRHPAAALDPWCAPAPAPVGPGIEAHRVRTPCD